MQEKSCKLSVIVPVYNEEAVITPLYFRLCAAVQKITLDYELIFVNDGSKDNTLPIISELALQDEKVKYLSFTRNFGHQLAVSAGLDHCIGNAVVIIDGDLQDPPELIPELYKEYLKGFKIVGAKRIKRKGDSFFKKLSANFFYRMLKSITEFDIPVDTGDFRLIDKTVVHQLRKMPEANKFIRGQIAWLGFKTSFVDFEREERTSGKSGYSIRKMLNLALDGITGFSNAPLKLVTLLGFLVSGFAFLIILYALYNHVILDRTITGWTSIIISSMFIGGIQLLGIGVIGEYISRINSNVRNRQLYIIEGSNIETTREMEEPELREFF